MKKVVIISLLFVFAVCAVVHYTVNPTLDDRYNDTIAVKIAESWLDKQLSLKEYEVIQAHSYCDKSGRTHIAMTYSVKPRKHAFTDWYSGNGEDGGDGWIVEKYGIIDFWWIGPFAVTGLACNTGP